MGKFEDEIDKAASRLFEKFGTIIREENACDGAIILAALQLIANLLFNLEPELREEAKKDTLMRADRIWGVAIARAAELDRAESPDKDERLQ